MKSISRIFLVTFLMIVIGAGLFALSSCDDFLDNTLPHEHVWGEWNIVEESTCAENGSKHAVIQWLALLSPRMLSLLAN